MLVPLVAVPVEIAPGDQGDADPCCQAGTIKASMAALNTLRCLTPRHC